MITAREELDDILANMIPETREALKDIPFDKLPIDVFALGAIIDALPEETKSKHVGLLVQVRKLNAMMGIGTFVRKPSITDPPEDVMREISFDEVAEILSSTIKKDDPAKLITFSAFLLAQTETDQINIGFQSESSAGKSYIPTEMSTYFPDSDIMLIAGASPMAFFHDRGQAVTTKVVDDKGEEKEVVDHYVVDVENKILIFLDQPHYMLLEKLRPLLSHDKKELTYKIADKNKSGGNRTKNIVIRGFPAVAFATTKMNPDEQEKTRMILLSPSIDHEKLEASLDLLALRKGNPEEYEELIENDPQRAFLKDRIKAIREQGVKEILILDYEGVKKRFKEKHTHLLARHQRDFPRVFSMIKAHALLNCFNREKRNGVKILANQTDIDAGFKLYEMIEESNEMGLSPHVLRIYKEVVKPLLSEMGTDKKEIRRQYYKVFHKFMDDTTWTKELLPQLEAGGLISQEQDPNDKRRIIYLPTENIWETSGGTKLGSELASTGLNSTLNVNISVPPDHSHISLEDRVPSKLFINILKELGMTRSEAIREETIIKELVKTEKFTEESAKEMLKQKRLDGTICHPAGWDDSWRFA